MINEEEVRKRIKEYFDVQELVGLRTYKRFGVRSWRFLDYRLLYALLIIREGLNKPITVNHNGAQQRGLRTIVQQMIKNYFYKNRLYLSAHLFGKAIDFDVKGMEAQSVRDWIVDNDEMFPFKIRLEDKVTWVHLDVIWELKNTHVYLFQPPK